MISTKKKTKFNYIDITDRWLKSATLNSHEVKERNYYEHQGKRYYVDNRNIVMNKGDFGVILELEFDKSMPFSVVVKIKKGNSTVITKTYSNVYGNSIEFALTENESSKLDVGEYTWNMYQYYDGNLKNTLVVNKSFIVKEGA